MDSIISLGQKNTLAEYMILSGADNRPPMLDKDLYDSWKSRMELYMQNREHGRMILESVEHGPLIWPTLEIRCGSEQKICCFAVLVFSPGDDPIACLNKAMAFLTCNKFKGDKGKIILVILITAMLLVQGEILQVDMQELLNATTAKVKDIWQRSKLPTHTFSKANSLSLSEPRNAAWYKRKQVLANAQEVDKCLDEEQLAFLADPGIPARSCSDSNFLTMLLSRLEES
ncbi:hypothetical protein Tco_0290659 [Tanacetum coccineum]